MVVFRVLFRRASGVCADGQTRAVLERALPDPLHGAANGDAQEVFAVLKREFPDLGCSRRNRYAPQRGAVAKRAEIDVAHSGGQHHAGEEGTVRESVFPDNADALRKFHGLQAAAVHKYAVVHLPDSRRKRDAFQPRAVVEGAVSDSVQRMRKTNAPETDTTGESPAADFPQTLRKNDAGKPRTAGERAGGFLGEEIPADLRHAFRNGNAPQCDAVAERARRDHPDAVRNDNIPAGAVIAGQNIVFHNEGTAHIFHRLPVIFPVFRRARRGTLRRRSSPPLQVYNFFGKKQQEIRSVR